MYFIFKRLMVNRSKEGHIIRDAMIEGLWMDCHNRIKAITYITGKERSNTLDDISYEFQVSKATYRLQSF